MSNRHNNAKIYMAIDEGMLSLADVCSDCAGLGLAAQEVTLEYMDPDSPNGFVQTTPIGGACPSCVGRGALPNFQEVLVVIDKKKVS